MQRRMNKCNQSKYDRITHFASSVSIIFWYLASLIIGSHSMWIQRSQLSQHTILMSS